MRPFAPKGTEGAGYPCTSPRLLKGTGDQGVFTDMGDVCCDTSSANGWSGAGADSIQKTIDVSQVTVTTRVLFLRNCMLISVQSGVVCLTCEHLRASRSVNSRKFRISSRTCAEMDLSTRW